MNDWRHCWLLKNNTDDSVGCQMASVYSDSHLAWEVAVHTGVFIKVFESQLISNPGPFYPCFYCSTLLVQVSEHRKSLLNFTVAIFTESGVQLGKEVPPLIVELHTCIISRWRHVKKPHLTNWHPSFLASLGGLLAHTACSSWYMHCIGQGSSKKQNRIYTDVQKRKCSIEIG